MHDAFNAGRRLAYLLAMEDDEVDAALSKYRGRVVELIEEIQFLVGQLRQQRTVSVEAMVSHLRMVQAHEFSTDPSLPSEVKTFYAALGAERIAQDAESVALGKGRLTELSRRMEEIRFREGKAGESWMPGEGPLEYLQLVDQRNALLRSVEQTMMVYLLRRYRLDEQAELYESNRAQFEVDREVGRIVMMEGGAPPDEQELANGFIGKTYGRDAVHRVLSRLREIRREA